MAAGSIVVDLLMRTGSFVTDTDRARKQLQKLKKDAIETGKNLAFSFVGVGAGVAGVLAALDSVADGIANYQDVADTIGDSAEAVSGLQLALDQSGTSIDTVTALSSRLASALSKTDDESKGVGAGIKALGLDLEAFKQQAPVERLESLAKAFAGFADGPEKTAVAIAIMGKAGASALPFLNDLAEAGGRQVRLTSDQIEAADRFSKSLSTMRSEGTALGRVLAAELYPALNNIVEGTMETIKGLGGVKGISALLRGEFADLLEQLQPLASGLITVGRYAGAAAAAIEMIRSGNSAGAQTLFSDLKRDIADADKTMARFIARVRDANGTYSSFARFQADPTELARRGRPVATRPSINITGLLGDRPPPGGGRRGGGGGGAVERTSEAERYLEALQKQLDRTRELSTVETVLSDIQSGRLKLSGSVTQEQLTNVARLIDASKAFESQMEAERRQEQDLAEERRRNGEELRSLFESTRTPAEKLATEIDRINRLTNFGAKDWDLYARAMFNAQDAYDASLKKNDDAADKLGETARELGLTFTSAFEDAVVSGQGLGSVIKSLGQDIERLLFRKLITEPGADFISGLLKGGGGGGGIGGAIGNLFSSFFGGAKAGGGDVLPGRAYLVGENGPEPFIPRTAGRILPNSALAAGAGGGGGPTYISVNVPAGTQRATASQIAAEVSRELRRSNARNN